MKRFLIFTLALLFAIALAFGQIGQSPVKSKEKAKFERYVRALYKDVQNREGDASGIKYWTDQLIEDKLSKEDVVKVFLNSQEYRERFVRNIYGWFHDREPDAAGLKYWSDFMKENDERAILRSFVLSEEFWSNSNQNNRDWVENLYWTLQSRKPDVSGLEYWTKQLKSGMPKAQVVDAFMNSPEYREKMIKFLYDWYQKREPDSGGLKYWTEQLQEKGARQIILLFLTGEEYWNRVTKS
jgi:hypothetical protein